MAGTLNDVTKGHIERQYAELREADPDEHRACVQRAAALSVKHKLAAALPGITLIEFLADLEYALVETALRNRGRRGGR
jgi:hypothetical protein